MDRTGPDVRVYVNVCSRCEQSTNENTYLLLLWRCALEAHLMMRVQYYYLACAFGFIRSFGKWSSRSNPWRSTKASWARAAASSVA